MEGRRDLDSYCGFRLFVVEDEEGTVRGYALRSVKGPHGTPREDAFSCLGPDVESVQAELRKMIERELEDTAPPGQQ